MLQKIKGLFFENKSLGRRIAKNTLWLFSGQLIGRFIRVLIVIYAARILGPESWGAFSYAMSLAAFMLIFSDIGISAIVTKETARRPELTGKYFSTALAIKIFLLVAGMAILLFGAPYLTKIEEAKIIIPIIIFVLLFDSLRNFGFAVSRSAEKMEIEGINEIATNLFISLFGFAALYMEPTAKSLAISYAAAVGVGFFLIAYKLKNYLKNILSHIDFTLIKPILKTAWPFALASSLGAIMINTDTIIIGWMRTPAEVGFYSAAQRPVQLLYVLPTLFAVSLFPVFSRLAKEKTVEFKSVLLNALKIAFFTSIPIAIIGIIFGKEIITLLFGANYLSAIPAFQILMLTVLIIFPSAIITNATLALDQQKKFIAFSALGAFGNIALDILLIPTFGIIGCAVATVITQIIANSFMWLRIKRHIK